MACYLHHSQKKQFGFKHLLADNSYAPFQHLNISEKCHPFSKEISALIDPSKLDVWRPFTIEDHSKEHVWVGSRLQLEELANTLSMQKVFAVDTEQHSLRSYLGFTALIQISTREEDYIVDAIALHDDMGLLHPAFCDPRICKVFHGAQNDVLWLQRDFHIYVVNLFDTYTACVVLKKPENSLKYLLESICNVATDKSLRLRDWTERPLSNEMLQYARKDTQYLLSIADFLIDELQKCDNYLLEATKRSHKTCLQLYARPQDDMKLVSRLGQDLKLRELVWRLCCWRDLMARIHDESRSYVLSDEAIMNLARQEPRTPSEICKAVSPIISGSNMLDDISCSIDDESSVSETVGCHLYYLQQLISEKLVPLEQILSQILDKSLGSNGTCPVNLFNRSIRESFKINHLGSPPMRSAKDSPKESMTSKLKWKCGKCVKCGKDGKEMVSYRKIPLAYRKHFPDHLNEDRSSDTVLLCEDCHRLAHAAGENFKRKMSSEIGLCSPVGDTKECQDIRRAAKALLYKSSALPEQRRKEMMETVEKHYGRGNLSHKDLESAQQIGLSSKREKQETGIEKQTIEYLLKNSGEDGVRRFCQEWRDQFDSL